MTDKVNFGFLKVSKKIKDKMVSDLFTSVSDKYDLMNDAMSFGLHRLWKKKMVSMCNPETIAETIDIASGTGDITLKLLKKNKNLSITCLDNSQEMLQICKNKMVDNGFIKNIEYICSSVEQCALKENTFDLATTAFGFRNFTDQNESLKNIYRILKPGGKIVLWVYGYENNQIYIFIYKLLSFFTNVCKAPLTSLYDTSPFVPSDLPGDPLATQGIHAVSYTHLTLPTNREV